MTTNQNQTSTRRTSAIASILLLLLGVPVGAQLGTSGPAGKPQYFDDSGNACASCTLTTYVTGASSVLLDTYTTAALNVANSNPQTLDAAGRPVTGLYLTPGLTYRFVFKTAAGAPIWTYDGIAGPNGVAADRLRVSAHSATIATGAFTATYSQYAVDTEGAAASDDLDTITAGTGIGAGTLLLVTPANVSHVVTAKDSTGNLKLGGGDYALDSAKKSLTLYYDGSNWVEVARAGIPSSISTLTVGTLTVSGNTTLTGTTTLTGAATVSAADSTVKIGASSETAKFGGVINTDSTALATGANTNDTALFTYSLPANALNANGRVVKVTAWGNFAGNGNSKTIRLKWNGIGGTTVATHTSTANGIKWLITGYIVRTGSSTQDLAGAVIVSGASQDQNANNTTSAATDTGAIDIVVSAQNGSASADIQYEGSIIEFLN